MNLFSKYQPQLLKLANHPLGRKFLGLDKECKDKIVGLAPNAYAIQVGRRKFQSTFRCYNLFEKKLGGALKFSDSFLEGIKYYFTPQEFRWIEYCASPETFYSSVGDGAVRIDNAVSWTLARDGSTATHVDGTDTTADYLRSESSGSTFWNGRVFLPFDSSALPSNISVSSGILTMVLNGKTENGGTCPNEVVVQTTQASISELVAADYGKISFAAGSDEVSVPSAGNTITFTLNGTGRGWVNNTATKLAVITTYDQSNTTAPEVDEVNAIYRMSEYADTSSDPKLVVTYTLPVADSANSGFYLI